jgi:hypothetical protein
MIAFGVFSARSPVFFRRNGRRRTIYAPLFIRYGGLSAPHRKIVKKSGTIVAFDEKIGYNIFAIGFFIRFTGVSSTKGRVGNGKQT